MPADRAPDRTASVAGPAPAGRLTAKGQRTRQRIVAAAAELIFERGVAGTTIEDVQAAAGVSASQLYHYFPSKNDLVRAVIQYQEQGVVGAQERALAHLDTLDGLRAWADAVVDVQRQMHCRGGCPIGSLGSELAETDPEARFEVAASFERWAGAIRDGLRSMQAHGRLSAAASPDDLAVAVLAALQGGFLVGQVQRSIRPLQIALDAMLALIATYAASPTSLRGLQAQDLHRRFRQRVYDRAAGLHRKSLADGQKLTTRANIAFDECPHWSELPVRRHELGRSGHAHPRMTFPLFEHYEVPLWAWHFAGPYRFELVPASSHFLQREQPQPVTKLVLDWFARRWPVTSRRIAGSWLTAPELARLRTDAAYCSPDDRHIDRPCVKRSVGIRPTARFTLGDRHRSLFGEQGSAVEAGPISCFR